MNAMATTHAALRGGVMQGYWTCGGYLKDLMLRLRLFLVQQCSSSAGFVLESTQDTEQAVIFGASNLLCKIWNAGDAGCDPSPRVPPVRLRDYVEMCRVQFDE